MAAERDALGQRAIDRRALAALTDVHRRFELDAAARLDSSYDAAARPRFERDGGRTGGLSASGRPAAAATRAHHGNAPRGLGGVAAGLSWRVGWRPRGCHEYGSAGWRSGCERSETFAVGLSSPSSAARSLGARSVVGERATASWSVVAGRSPRRY